MVSPESEVGLVSPGKSGKGLGKLSAPVRLTCFVVAPSPHLGQVGWAQETWVQTSALGALVSKQAEWAHSKRVHTKAQTSVPQQCLLVLSLTSWWRCLHLSTTCGKLWVLKQTAPSLSLEPLNVGTSLGRRWERTEGVKACPQGHLGVSQRRQPPGLVMAPHSSTLAWQIP